MLGEEIDEVVIEVQVGQFFRRRRRRRAFQDHRLDLRRRQLVVAFPLQSVADLLQHPARLPCCLRPEQQEQIAVVDVAVQLLFLAAARFQAEHVLKVVDADLPEHLHALQDLVPVGRSIGDKGLAVALGRLADRFRSHEDPFL